MIFNELDYVNNMLNNGFIQNSYLLELKLLAKYYNKIESGDIGLPPRQYKNYLIEKYGNKCMECGWGEKNPTTNKIPIELEHIDGDSTNNNLSNLKLLCPNCHSLTSTYKGANKGNGRYSRKVRYKEGKSY